MLDCVHIFVQIVVCLKINNIHCVFLLFISIFLESGYPTRKTEKCEVGDIMSLYIDFERNKGFFRRNGKKMIELNLNPNKLAYYPMIGMHSCGEAVQIMEPELWEPRTEADVCMLP